MQAKDFILRVLSVGIPGLVGVLMTADNVPWFDAVTFRWAVLVAMSCAALWAIAQRERYREQHQEIDGKLNGISQSIQQLIDAQHNTMRATIMHNAEKYITRGWATAEEKQATIDMFSTYEKLGLNGFIKSYVDRVLKLPERKV